MSEPQITAEHVQWVVKRHNKDAVTQYAKVGLDYDFLSHQIVSHGTDERTVDVTIRNKETGKIEVVGTEQVTGQTVTLHAFGSTWAKALEMYRSRNGEGIHA